MQTKKMICKIKYKTFYFLSLELTNCIKPPCISAQAYTANEYVLSNILIILTFE